MGLDIRWPIGLMFTLLGAMLAFNGVRDHSDHAISLGININLIWGAVLLVFGVLMLLGAVMGKGKADK
jgi:ABC-type Fe3+-siderophore transport system permease subunit